MQKITGSKMERCCDLCHITLNKNAVIGDVSAMTPGGVRIGAPAMTSRGLKEADFEQIAEFLHEAMEMCKDIQNKHGKLLKDFNKYVSCCGDACPHSALQSFERNFSTGLGKGAEQEELYCEVHEHTL